MNYATPGDLPWPNNKHCVMEPGHAYSCNGYPRPTCLVWSDEAGAAIPLKDHTEPVAFNRGPALTKKLLREVSASVAAQPRTPYPDSDAIAALYDVVGNGSFTAPAGRMYALPDIGPCKKKPWHLRLRQHLYNLRSKWKLHIYWGDNCGNCEYY
jgi:hypothetical protein